LKLPPGHRLVHFERINSTNAEARRLAEAGERGPLWLWADEQTAGRGRLGRSWVSEPGNLYATLLFSTAAPTAVVAQVGFAAAVAVHEMVQRLLPDADIKLKWPNDVLLDGAKFCGLLAEIAGPAGNTMALGWGLNLVSAPAATPYPVTWLARHGAKAGVEKLLELLAETVWNWLTVWDEGRGFARIREAWLQRCAGLGRAIFVQSGNTSTAGVFRGLAEDGALILGLPGGRQRTIHAGDVRFAASAPGRRGR
jgi:BirA family transcriptional regulator, biotin operon repressor / biotin---[acetyl-CoA-carboxylase] ligase